MPAPNNTVSIDDMPTEILAQILAYRPSPRYRLVCHQWNNVLHVPSVMHSLRRKCPEAYPCRTMGLGDPLYCQKCNHLYKAELDAQGISRFIEYEEYPGTPMFYPVAPQKRARRTVLSRINNPSDAEEEDSDYVPNYDSDCIILN